MKHWKAIFVALAITGLLIVPSASAQQTAPYTADMVEKVQGSGSGHNLTSVKDEGSEVIITITNVRLSPIGQDTKGAGLASAQTVELYSGIMDAAGVKKPFAVASVTGNSAVFRIPNTAKAARVPVVEHIWGRGNNGQLALVHDPADPWVCYKMKGGQPDLNTLAIGLVMYPSGQTKSLKPLGKLDQGKHPELQ